LPIDLILGEEKDLLPLKRLIIDRTEGNPFFMLAKARAKSVGEVKAQLQVLST